MRTLIPSWGHHPHLLLLFFSCSVVSDSLWPHGFSTPSFPVLHHLPEVYSNSCPSSQWCHPTISSSVVPFSSCPQSFPASGSFQMSQLFTSGGQSIGVSHSRWVITTSWLSGSWRSFLYSFSVYSCHLFLKSFASLRSKPFLSFIVPIFAWNVPLVSIILLKRSLVFPILLFFSISLHCSLRNAFLSLLAILWIASFRWVSFLFSFAFCFSSFLSYLSVLLRWSFFLFSFLFLGYNFDYCLLYNIMSLSPSFFRHSIGSNPLNLFVTSTNV